MLRDFRSFYMDVTFVMSEREQQKYVIKWARENEPRFPALRWLHSIPNGAYMGGKAKGARQMAQLKAEGLLVGVADLCLPDARIVGGEHFHGLYIEMKDGQYRTTSPQKAFLEGMGAGGYRAVVCHSGLEAVEVLRRYVTGDKWKAEPKSVG